MGSDYGVKLLPADWVGRPDYFGDTTVADPGMVQKLGPVPDGNVLGRLSEYSSSFKDGPTFVQRAGQSHTWESVFMSEDSFGELLAVAQAAKDTNAVADVGAVVPNACPDVNEQQDTVDLTDDDPSPETAAAAEVVRPPRSPLPSPPSDEAWPRSRSSDVMARKRRSASRGRLALTHLVMAVL